MKVFVGGCVGRDYQPDHVRCLMQLLRHPARVRYQPTFNDALLCRARSKVATEFLERTDDDVLLSIDSDIVFDPKQAIEICEQAMTHDIVAGVYVTRTRGSMCFPTSLAENGQTITYGADTTPVPIKWAGGGFVAIHRRVFEALAKRPDCPMVQEDDPQPFRPFYTPFVVPKGNGTSIYLSEDWAVCERARQEGFTVHVNPSVRLRHLGLHPFTLEDLLIPQVPTQEIRLTRREDGRYDILAANPAVLAA